MSTEQRRVAQLTRIARACGVVAVAGGAALAARWLDLVALERIAPLAAAVALVLSGTALLVLEAETRRSLERLEVGRRTTAAELRVEIADRQRLADDLERSRDELARSNVELAEFAGVASHDLHEPLRAVGGCLTLLRERLTGSLEPRNEELMQHAVDGVERMQELIDGLLTYARVRARSGPLERVDATDCLETALADLRTALAESGGNVTHDRLPEVAADAPQLAQVLQNLVGNALKFRGEAPPIVHVDAERVEGGWRFAVRDNGIGVAAEHHERIFGAFQRLHARSRFRGSGIGLATCKRIVEAHGGRIWVQSRPGDGATFYFTLQGAE